MAVVHHHGIAIDLLDQGAAEAGAAPLLLLHSAGMGAGQWRNLISHMSDRFRLVAPNQRGYGRSEKWPEGTITDFAAERAFLATALDHIGGPVHLVGHSMGAFLALEMARRAPARFPTLTLIEPVSLGVLHSAGATEALAEVGGMIERFCAACAGGNIDGAMETFTDYWYGAGAWQKIPKAQRLPIFARAGKMYQDVRAIWADKTPAAAYRGLAIPVLIVTGERTTPAARRMAELIAAELPGARRAELPTAGHMAPVTHADLIAALIADHVAEAATTNARGGIAMTDALLSRDRMRARIEAYYADCNRGDASRIARHFTADAIHYFPATERYGAFRSALGIGQAWADTVEHTGARWTVDRFIGDPDMAEAVVEWTQFRPKQGKRLRGDEWYKFDPKTCLIVEVRAYFAATEHDGRKIHELGEFDYAGRGYPMTPPKV